MSFLAKDDQQDKTINTLPKSDTEKHIAQVFGDILVDAGIDHVFGMPGGNTPFMFDGLVDRKDDINTVLVRHEAGTTIMADMYARITGKPAVVLGQGPWIGTSGGIGILESLFSGLPMVVVCDTSDYFSMPQHGPYQNGTGDYGAFDLVSMMRSMTKYTTLASNPSEFIHGLQQAIKHSVTGKPGPCAVLMKWNVAFENVKVDEVNPKVYSLGGYLNVSPPCISDADADNAADLLAGAEKPVIIAGQGVRSSGAYDALAQLAEMTGIPVATSYLGKSAIPETHDLALGTIGGIGQKIANQKVMDADVILAVGTALSPENTKWLDPGFINPMEKKIIQIDIESRNAGWTYPVALGITSDANLALTQISRRMEGRVDRARVEDRIETLKKEKEQALFFNEELYHSGAAPMAPERVVKAVNQAVTEDDLVVLDAGNNRMFFTHHFQTKKAAQLLAAGGVAAIGYGPIAALGTQMTCPDKRVICVCGDGGLMQHLYIFEMAKTMNLPVTWVVLNNSCLGNVMDFQPPERRIATTYDTIDYEKIVAGFGIETQRVETPEELDAALKKGLESDGPMLVNAIVEDAPHFRLME